MACHINVQSVGNTIRYIGQSVGSQEMEVILVTPHFITEGFVDCPVFAAQEIVIF